jgi:hypothetical protein
LVAPSGIGPSGTVEPPPPRSSEPQARLRIVTLLPSLDTPHAPLPLKVDRSSTTVPAGGTVEVEVLEVVDVLVVVGPAVLVVVGAAVVDVVVVPGTVVAVCKSTTVPESVVAPGPGRLAAKLMIAAPVAGMQNTEARVNGAGVSVVSGPAGEPTSVMFRQAWLPKQPT